MSFNLLEIGEEMIGNVEDVEFNVSPPQDILKIRLNLLSGDRALSESVDFRLELINDLLLVQKSVHLEVRHWLRNSRVSSRGLNTWKPRSTAFKASKRGERPV